MTAIQSIILGIMFRLIPQSLLL